MTKKPWTRTTNFTVCRNGYIYRVAFHGSKETGHCLGVFRHAPSRARPRGENGVKIDGPTGRRVIAMARAGVSTEIKAPK